MWRGLAIICGVISLMFLADWLAYSPVDKVAPPSHLELVPVEFTKPGYSRDAAQVTISTNWHRTNIPANHLTFSSGWPGKPGAPMIPEVPICELRLEASTNWPWGGEWYEVTNWPTNASQVILERSNFPNWTLFRTIER